MCHRLYVIINEEQKKSRDKNFIYEYRMQKIVAGKKFRLYGIIILLYIL